ncbi:hypothetical protein GCM10010174_64740 [Kutzneria viridogrisea]
MRGRVLAQPGLQGVRVLHELGGEELLVGVCALHGGYPSSSGVNGIIASWVNPVYPALFSQRRYPAERADL